MRVLASEAIGISMECEVESVKYRAGCGKAFSFGARHHPLLSLTLLGEANKLLFDLVVPRCIRGNDQGISDAIPRQTTGH